MEKHCFRRPGTEEDPSGVWYKSNPQQAAMRSRHYFNVVSKQGHSPTHGGVEKASLPLKKKKKRKEVSKGGDKAAILYGLENVWRWWG